ncbi:MAG: isoamylase early set domain-containing protein [Gemmatimonadetes bacterium]|nr:isoamylase early set domain-containing protein [Gemmatimonadota bacterium]
MTEYEDTLARVVETLKEPVRIDSSFDRRVMAEIEQLPQLGPTTTNAGSRVAWLARRWTLRLSPLGGLAAAATIAGVMLAASLRTGPREPTAPPVASAQPVAGALTQFVLVAPEAASVAVVGDFNDWSFSATPLARQAGDGIWWVTVPLQPGRYRYAFVVNGENWRSDPNEPAAEDEFGRPNSVVTIGGV